MHPRGRSSGYGRAGAATGLPDANQGAGANLLDALEHAGRGVDQPESWSVEPARVDGGVEPGKRQQGLGLGRERDATAVLGHVQRLDSEAVTSQRDRAVGGVIERKREHTLEAGERVFDTKVNQCRE